MDLGLSVFSVGDGELGRRLNCKWAHIYPYPPTESEPELLRPAIDEAIANGMRPIIDCRTTMIELGQMMYRKGDPLENKAAAVNWYVDQILHMLDTYLHVRHVEIWGNAEIAHLSGGPGTALNYATVLTQVYERLHTERPEVEVWTGGFGANCLPDFVRYALVQHAPKAFDVCNMHPYIASCGTLDADIQTADMRLCMIRKLLDDECAGQPLASSSFGVPTVPGLPMAYYGQFVRLPKGGRAIPEAEAARWYVAMLALLKAHKFRVVCLRVRDDERLRWLHDFAGLVRRDGVEKEHLPRVIEWCQDNAEDG